MARPRVIDQEHVLDAAEIVVGRVGAAHLTLDAVAVEAGISKGSVTYDYGTKQCLIRAIIERRIRLEKEKVQAEVERFGNAPNATLRGRIAAAACLESDEAKAVAINLCSALSQDTELRSCMQDSYREQIGSVLNDTRNDRKATVAFLALEGFKILEYFSFSWWAPEERETILKDIAALVDTEPPRKERPAEHEPHV